MGVVAIAIDDGERSKRLRQWEAGKPGWLASLACMIGAVFPAFGQAPVWLAEGRQHTRAMLRRSYSLGVGEGAFSDVHARAPGQVVKLFKAGFPRRLGWWEARMTRAAFAAGLPAPEVLEGVTLEGRFGVVLSRLDGPTLLQLSRTGGVTFGQARATLALSVHKTLPPPDVLSLRDVMDSSLRFSDGIVPEHIATGILALIERLRPGDGLRHCDLHPAT